MRQPKFSRIDMDAVAPLLPHDKTAAMVGSQGVTYEFHAQAGQAHSSEPIAWRAPNRQEWGQANFVDLTARMCGRLTIMGIAADLKTSNGQNWVVRCVCGAYETRKAKYIKANLAGKRERGDEPMCLWCRNTRRLQQGRGQQSEEQKWRAAAGISREELR